MYARFKTALAIVFVASMPLHLRAAPQNSQAALNEKEIRAAEAAAKTPADHVRLAVYYESKADQARRKLADAEDQMQHWSWLQTSTKVPNAYTSSRSLVERYRAEFERTFKLAANHRSMAGSEAAK
jgi:hypothetical protein